MSGILAANDVNEWRTSPPGACVNALDSIAPSAEHADESFGGQASSECSDGVPTVRYRYDHFDAHL